MKNIQSVFYCGVDINKPAVLLAQKHKKDLPFKQEFKCEDIVKIDDEREYDMVVCLGEADYDPNEDYDGIVSSAWRRVKPKGTLILSGRYTNLPSVYNIKDSYQLVENDKDKNDDRVPYVVINIFDWIEKIKKLKNLGNITGMGYYGRPVDTVRTMFDEVCFGTMGIQKSAGGDTDVCLDLNFHLRLFDLKK